MTGFAAPAMVIMALAAANPSDDFERGRNAFFRGEYARAIGLLHPLLYPDLRLGSEQEVIQTHKMLGVAHLFENQPDDAKREFRKLLELAPDFEFDPYLDPPRVVEFFQSVVREQRDELGDIEARLKKRDAALSKRTSGGILERRITRHAYGLNFVPFGAGQFQNGDRRKGWWFLGAESTLAVTSMTAFVVNFATFGVRPFRPCMDKPVPQPDGSPGLCAPDRIDHTGENISTALTTVQVAAGGLFVAAALWGIVDAIRHFQAEVPAGEIFLPTPTPTTGPAESPSSERAVVPHAREAASRRTPTPCLTPTGSGVLLGFSF